MVDETRHAELPQIPLSSRNHQPRRLAVSPLRSELSRCRRSPGPTRHHGVLRSDPAGARTLAGRPSTEALFFSDRTYDSADPGPAIGCPRLVLDSGPHPLGRPAVQSRHHRAAPLHRSPTKRVLSGRLRPAQHPFPGHTLSDVALANRQITPIRRPERREASRQRHGPGAAPSPVRTR